jgi:hypothetical protein
MGTPLTYSKEDIKSIDKRKDEAVKIKIKPDQISKKEFLAKIEFLEKDIGKIVTGGYGAAMQTQDRQPTLDYRETMHRTAASLRSKINEVKSLHVAPDCEKLKQLFTEVYDGQANYLVRRADGASGIDESNLRKELTKKKDQYDKEKEKVRKKKF